jgi:hypothetical protein
VELASGVNGKSGNLCQSGKTARSSMLWLMVLPKETREMPRMTSSMCERAKVKNIILKVAFELKASIVYEFE